MRFGQEGSRNVHMNGSVSVTLSLANNDTQRFNVSFAVPVALTNLEVVIRDVSGDVVYDETWTAGFTLAASFVKWGSITFVDTAYTYDFAVFTKEINLDNNAVDDSAARELESVMILPLAASFAAASAILISPYVLVYTDGVNYYAKDSVTGASTQYATATLAIQTPLTAGAPFVWVKDISPAGLLGVVTVGANQSVVYEYLGKLFVDKAIQASLNGNTTDMGVGTLALDSNTTGNDNTALGNEALRNTTSGNDNTAVGYRALLNGNPSYNTAVGSTTMEGVGAASGHNNSAVGRAAMFDYTTASGNAVLGDNALSTITTGNNNTAIGYVALGLLNSGSNNTAIGHNAGSAYTGAESGNVIIGEGVAGTVGESNVLRLGNVLIGDLTLGAIVNPQIANPAHTFAYTLTGAAILGNRILNLPLTGGTDTLAALGVIQTWSAQQIHSAQLDIYSGNVVKLYSDAGTTEKMVLDSSIGKITKYNGTSTVGMGVPSIVGATLQKSETGAADNNLLTVTPASVAGSYRISFTVTATSATNGVIALTISYQDAYGAAVTNKPLLMNSYGSATPVFTVTISAASYELGVTELFDVDNSGTNIVVKWTGGGTIVAKASVIIEKVQ